MNEPEEVSIAQIAVLRSYCGDALTGEVKRRREMVEWPLESGCRHDVGEVAFQRKSVRGRGSMQHEQRPSHRLLSSVRDESPCWERGRWRVGRESHFHCHFSASQQIVSQEALV